MGEKEFKVTVTIADVYSESKEAAENEIISAISDCTGLSVQDAEAEEVEE